MENVISKFGPTKEGAARKLTNLSEGDLWAGTPILSPSAKDFDSEHVTPMLEGAVVEGVFRGLRVTKKEENDYAIMDHAENGKYRIYTPGQLKYNLSNIPVGTLVRITYLGTEDVEGFPKPLHQFKVEADVKVN